MRENEGQTPMRRSIYKINAWVLLVGLFLLLIPSRSHGQQSDSTRTFMGSNIDLDSMMTDSSKIVEDAALDIGQNRGLFIVTPGGEMQLRILGSVRYLVVYDDTNMELKNSFSTFDIPVNVSNHRLPNYYNGLHQSRLGFEITRRTDKGNVFMRLETDFAGPYGFRIRHAYGQYSNFLFGQTWSLFSQVSFLPATVGFGGPTGSISVRSPQIRYTAKNLIPASTVSLGLEYFKPDYTLPDSVFAESFQLIPDITGRIQTKVRWGSLQLSGIVPILTARTEEGTFVARPGWGVSFATVIESWAGGKWYLQAGGGQAINRYYHDLSGKGLDLLFDTETNTTHLPFTFGGYATYEHHWSESLYSNFTYSVLLLQREPFTPEDTYDMGDNFRFNTFWSIVEGARVGAELIYASRKNKDKARGTAARLNLLFYYDF